MCMAMSLELLRNLWEFLMDHGCYQLANEVWQEMHERETIRDLILDYVESEQAY